MKRFFGIESYFRALSSRLSSLGGSARRPGGITFAAMNIRDSVAVGSGLEGLAERDLVS